MTASTKRPWHMFYPLAGMILISALWCGYWYFAFTGAKNLVQAKRLEFTGKGLQLSCARESWGGFPFRFEFQCETASLQFTGAAGTHNIRSTKVMAVAQAYNPFHVLFLIDGPSAIDDASLTHRRALISISVAPGGDWDMSSEASKVDAGGLFSAGQVKLFARKVGDRLDLAANTDNLVVPATHNSIVSLTKAGLLAKADISILNQPFRGPTAEQPLEINSLKLSQGPVDLSAQGRIFLDPQHRLAGNLSSQTNDIDGLMKIILPIFELNSENGAAIKNLLANQKTETAKADFTAGEGALYWGLLKLADLAPLY